ncbi:hypothetical protein G6F40_015495 [Rhizopus arrhizus]|nr:hypothetical protein G6F40_015495 [Rhizopus arrhizus]
MDEQKATFPQARLERNSSLMSRPPLHALQGFRTQPSDAPAGRAPRPAAADPPGTRCHPYAGRAAPAGAGRPASGRDQRGLPALCGARRARADDQRGAIDGLGLAGATPGPLRGCAPADRDQPAVE